MRSYLLCLEWVAFVGFIVLGGGEVDMIRGVLQQHHPDGSMNNDFGRQWYG